MALSKIIKYTFVPGTAGTPGYPGIPARPAYSYTAYNTVCTYNPGSYDDALSAIAALLGTSLVDASARTSYSADGYLCAQVPYTVYVPAYAGVPPIPAVPATQSQLLSDFDLGWTGQAHSIEMMEASGRYEFRVPANSVGAIVGLATEHKDSGYGHIQFGFYVARGLTKIMESSVVVDSLGERPDQLLEVRRSGGNIEYRVDGVVERTVPAPAGMMLLSASLYSGGDEVIDAEYVELGDGGGTGAFRPLRGYASESAVFAFGIGELQPFVGEGSARARGEAAGVMLPFKGKGGIAYAWGESQMSAFVGQGEGLIDAPEFALGAGSFLGFTGTATGMTGGVGSGAGASESFVGFAGEGAFAAGAGRMRPFRSTVYNLNPANQAFVSSVNVQALGALSPYVELFAVMNSAAEVVGLVTISTEYLAELMSVAEAATPAELQAQYDALLASLMQSSSLLSDPAGIGASDTWVYNVDVKGTTRYDHYDFNSFATIGGRHYGARADGIYELTGQNDAGVDVTVKVDFGDLSFGTLSRKALPMCYAGVASDGKLLLKVVADGQTHIYSTTDFDAGLKAQRFILGRGLRASFYNVTLINEGGSAFALDSIQFMPVTLTRRQ